MVRGLKFRIKEVEGFNYFAKTKVLISCRCVQLIIVQLICTFVFAHAKSRFSHDISQLYQIDNVLQYDSLNHPQSLISAFVLRFLRSMSFYIQHSTVYYCIAGFGN